MLTAKTMRNPSPVLMYWSRIALYSCSTQQHCCGLCTCTLYTTTLLGTPDMYSVHNITLDSVHVHNKITVDSVNVNCTLLTTLFWTLYMYTVHTNITEDSVHVHCTHQHYCGLRTCTLYTVNIILDSYMNIDHST